MGGKVATTGSMGMLQFASGTSFSCPILAGGVACLLQAYFNRTPTDIMQAVRTTADNAEHPDNIFGYGIANLKAAYERLSMVEAKED